MFEAQKMFKSNDCWIEQVENDLKVCEINLSDEEIKNFSKFQMKKLVLSGIKLKAQEFLMKLKDSYVKTEQLVPSDEIQEYLTTEELTTAEKRLLFKLKIQKID